MDLNEELGRASKGALDKQFDTRRTMFVPCDVSNEEQLKGEERNILVLLVFFYLVNLCNVWQSTAGSML